MFVRLNSCRERGPHLPNFLSELTANSLGVSSFEPKS